MAQIDQTKIFIKNKNKVLQQLTKQQQKNQQKNGTFIRSNS